ncbi:MAG: VWA domain-containing protein [Ruminococcus sp.]|uniref:vWA domain-containing protein n=1 Tax=Ruminococcus sp. TaxID=41978 RepID=UPI001B2A2780|nr:VWA domain-containing protein [Ruminococcus sp.]MBO7474619.1 VWA domain-containing protein [Ruminococcus sp.]
MNKSKTPLVIAVIGAIITMVMIMAVINRSSSNKEKPEPSTGNKITIDKPEEKLQKALKDIQILSAEPIKGTVDYSDKGPANLPNIETKYPLTVVGEGDVNIEIFSTSEKAGKKNNGWLNETAEEFNNQRNRLSNGKIISVSVRSIPSGASSDYIANNVYIPQAYTPSNELFGKLAAEQGAKLKLEAESLVSNTAGIAISRTAASSVKSKYGSVTFENIVDAVVAGELQMGYTYPYTSATGLNFLINALQHFDSGNILSDSAVSTFQQLQKSIPFVCYTTDQMVNAMQSGTLQAGVVEFQAYTNSAVLKGGYDFIPFGYKHSNPLYSVGDLTTDQQAALNTFLDFALSSGPQAHAKEYGFDPDNSFGYNTKDISGSDIISAQRLWKEEKDSGTPTIALFIADVSGSMTGDPLNRLKDSLLEASKNIRSDNYVGLITYNDNVTLNLPIAQFDLEQRSYFAGAVEKMKAGGNTATYDALLVGINMINEYKESIPSAKTMIFVLSDGRCNRGVEYNPAAGIVSHYGIPIYTIGYNEEIDSLKDLSSINEAVYIDADSDDVVYELSALFNAQM